MITTKEGTTVLQLRIYTLRTPAALQQYATVHWARHLTTFAAFGVTVHGVWTEHTGDAHRLIALVGFPPGADPDEFTRRVMVDPQFAADMTGFDVTDIVDVQTTLLDPAPYSPIH
jgi:hypothetical protein